jgi:hypothetical protein
MKVQQNDDTAKSKMKENADKKSRAKVSSIQIGDSVLIHQRKQNKLSTKFDPSPFRVVRKKGTMITVLRGGKYVTRNASFCKRIDPSMAGGNESSEEEEEQDDLTSSPNPQGNTNQNVHHAIPNANVRRYPV